MPWVQNAQVNFNGNAYVYDFFHQNLAHNCVPSALVMMVRYALGRNLALGIAQLWLRESQDPAQAASDAAHCGPSIARPGTFDAANPLPRVVGRRHLPAAGWHFAGQGANEILAFFSLQRHYPAEPWHYYTMVPVNAMLPTNLGHLALLANCTPAAPAMVGINWFAGGGHSALCLGCAPGTNDVIFLDPAHGVVACAFVHVAGLGVTYDTTICSQGGGGARGLIDEAVFYN